MYFLKGRVSTTLGTTLLSCIGLFDIGDGEYFNRLSVLDKSPLPVLPVAE